MDMEATVLSDDGELVISEVPVVSMVINSAQRMNLLRLFVRQKVLSKSNFEYSAVRNIANTACQTMKNITTYMTIHGHNIDRYFLTVNVSALTAPLACVILGSVQDSLPTEEVASAWKQAMNLLVDISQSFLPARLMLQSLEMTIEKVNSQLAYFSLAGDNLPFSNVASQINPTQARAQSTPPVNGDRDGDGSLAEGDFVPFPSGDITEIVSNPYLWRNTTW
jgi:hypothetical protein